MAGPAPLITVFMPVYNGQRFLREAVESILGQSFGNFELLVIDDGSTDQSPETVRSYRDPRIRFISNGRNLKLPATRNRGLELARGRYLANMDCDDISLPDRLLAQLGFLESHPKAGACGSWVQRIGYRGTEVRYRETVKYPTGPGYIKSRLLFDQPLANPSVMMNLEAVRAAGLKYRPEHLAGLEDWGFWQAASFCFEISNIPRVLLRYRSFSDNITHRGGSQRSEVIKAMNRKNLDNLGMEYSPFEDLMHYSHALVRDARQLKGFGRWLETLIAANLDKKIYPEEDFKQAAAWQWRQACFMNTRLGVAAWKAFWQAGLSQRSTPGALPLAKFAVKCLLKQGEGGQPG